MPRRDGTGPMGLGSRTGRGMGPCCGGYGSGGGYGMGMGYGRTGRMSKEDKKEMLKEESQYLKEDLDAIEKELAELEK